MATYIRLTDYKSSDEKEQEFFNPENRYEAKQEEFITLPGKSIAYWISNSLKKIFLVEKPFDSFSNTTAGIMTGNNEKFVKLWTEFECNKLGLNHKQYDEINKFGKKWFPVTRGGEFRRWYGNLDSVVNLENEAIDIKNSGHDYRLRDSKHYFQIGMTWTVGKSKGFSVREASIGTVFTREGQTSFPYNNFLYLISFLNTNVVKYFLEVLSPNSNYSIEHIDKLPTIFPKQDSIKQQIDQLTQQNIDISKEEWDSRETSWDFRANPLLEMLNVECSMLNEEKNSKFKIQNLTLEAVYKKYCEYWKEKFFTLHKNEEELNRLFIDIYELQDELTPDVELKDITILKNETKIIDGELVFQADEIMKQFISYGVGVMFGRYSLDSEGLQIANLGSETLVSQMIDETKVSFPIDDDNIIPMLEDDYFKDDIASRFVQFVKATFGEEDLSENIRFIESSLGTTLRKYFVKGFYEDHIKRYKKRPIYWMVASAKKGFMSLIYMHRFQADTFARVRNSYLTEYITKLEAHKETLTLTTTSETASNADKKSADKQMKNIDKKLKEIIEFDRDKMMSWSQNPTEIDLDDGVKVNYCKFKDILFPITGLCK